MKELKQSKWFTYILVAIAQFMVVLDSAITNVALPTIKQQLHFSESALQWVVTAYALTFGGFLLLGGRAADLFGRRRVLVSGMAAFTLFSFLIGISHSTFLLIAFRSLQGLSAAFMSPAALSIVLTTFRDGGPDRNRALAYWTLISTAGAAVGLLLGGALTEYIGWRWDFFVNVPVGILMTVLITRYVPKHERAEQYTGLDIPGAILITGSLMSLVFAFSQASSWGWASNGVLGTLALSSALLGAFVYNESKAKHPLVPLSIFRIRNVTGANLMIAPMYGAMMGIFFIISLYIQTILKFSPVVTGIAFLPFPLTLAFMSTQIPGLVQKYGFKRFLVAGPLIVAAGLLWLSQISVGGSYWTSLLPAFLIVPFGIGLTFMPILSAATSGVPGHQAGLASGLVSTSQQMGGALGLAIISSIAASVTLSSKHMNASHALVNGFDKAMLSGVVFMLFASILAATIIRQNRPNASSGLKVEDKQPRFRGAPVPARG